MSLKDIFSKSIKDLSLIEFYILLPIILWVIFLGIYPDAIIEPLKKDLLCFSNLKYIYMY